MPNLVGIGLSQVPTNGMLGGMAYQDPEHASIKNLDLKNLSQINSEIADTAVDVFVYDTRKDSDGGAWRKRTQNTSWYNETLNTPTRGSRKEFPAVAVIVATEDDVIIYDGDDPDLPMWMIFESSDTGTPYDTHYLGRGSGFSGFHPSITSVAMLNGILVVGKDGDSTNYTEAYTEIRFISDSAFHRDQTSAADMGNAISGRNGSAGGRISNLSYGGLVHFDLHDVAMTVLPNAPIDDTTGLPVPTIAVATAGGLSVIKDDGSVVDWTESSGPDSTHKLSFRKDGKLGVFTSGTAGAGGYPQLYYIDIPSGDISSSYYYAFASNNFEMYGGTAWETNTAGNLVMRNVVGSNPLTQNLTDVVDSPNLTYAATNAGLNAIIRPEAFSSGEADMTSAAVAYIQKDYNTGYMVGDIKGAFLSDTDATNVTGTELITNGTFDSNTTGWTSQNSATITHTTPSSASIDSPATDGLATPSSAGIIKIVSNGSASGAYQSFTTVVGKTYTASFIAYQVSYGSNYVKIGTSIGGHQNYDFYDEWDQSVNSNWASGSATFTATATTTYITLWPSQVSGRVLYMDQISVRLANPDRSVNDNGLAVYGTITKSAVATGAELVAYSGFSASNYLTSVQTAIDFGSSPNATICFISWMNQSTTGEYSYIMSAQDGTSTAPIGMAVHTSTGNFYVYEGTDVKSSSYPIVDGTWHHCVGIINGTSILGYVDGNKVIDTNTSNPPNLSGIDRFNVGHFRSGTSNLYHQRGSLALSRISKSIPSPEQIKKMYEDEKCLFHENAKATLYGSSDAVTALAFDDTTNTLHAGTSAGRSEFQGLCRINNTTDAVTTAISASNGFVAEQ